MATKKTDDEAGSERGKQVISIVSPETWERLEARRGRIPRSRYVADLIREHLDALDAAERVEKKKR